MHQEASGRGQHGAGLQRSRISYVLARAWSRPCRGLTTGEQGCSHTAPAEGSECCHRKERSAGLACAWNDGHPTRWQGAGGSTSIAHPGCQHSPAQTRRPTGATISVAAASDGHEHAGRRLSARRDAMRARTTPAEGVICPRRKRRPSSWGRHDAQHWVGPKKRPSLQGRIRSGADRAARIVGPHRAELKRRTVPRLGSAPCGTYRVARCDACASHGAAPMGRTVRRAYLWVARCDAYGSHGAAPMVARCGAYLWVARCGAYGSHGAAPMVARCGAYLWVAR